MDNLVKDIKFENEGPEPVILQEVKDWLRIDVPDDDTILSMLIPAARQRCEGFTNISFITRTVTAYLYIGLGEMRLPYGPVKNVISVDDYSGQPATNITVTTVTDDTVIKYEVFKAIDPCPDVVAVYEATPNIETDTLSAEFKVAVLCDIGWLYTNRGDASVANLSPMAYNILKPHRRVT